MPAAGQMKRQTAKVHLILSVIFMMNVAFWCGSRDIYSRWSGVPPAPTGQGALMMSLGDAELSYRSLALTLQSLGDLGVDTTRLKDYDYPELGRWFRLLSGLDPVSDHVPTLAAYYFGATRVPKDVAVVVDYLRVVGSVPAGEKWRWLAHAVYLAQHRMFDLSLALKMAYELARMPNSDTFPQWARQMPAFVLAKKGEKEAAREMMGNMIATDKNMSREEVNTLKGYMVEQLGVDPKDVDRIIRMRGGH